MRDLVTKYGQVNITGRDIQQVYDERHQATSNLAAGRAAAYDKFQRARNFSHPEDDDEMWHRTNNRYSRPPDPFWSGYQGGGLEHAMGERHFNNYAGQSYYVRHVQAQAERLEDQADQHRDAGNHQVANQLDAQAQDLRDHAQDVQDGVAAPDPALAPPPAPAPAAGQGNSRLGDKVIVKNPEVSNMLYSFFPDGHMPQVLLDDFSARRGHFAGGRTFTFADRFLGPRVPETAPMKQFLQGTPNRIFQKGMSKDAFQRNMYNLAQAIRMCDQMSINRNWNIPIPPNTWYD
jgi:hypothetical protein